MALAGNHGAVATAVTSKSHWKIGALQYRCSQDSSSQSPLMIENEKQRAEMAQFIASALHDLRSPLNSSSILTQLLLTHFASELPDEVTRIAEQIALQLNRMAALLTGLAAFSDANIAKHEVQPTQLDEVIGMACKALEVEIKESEVEIESEKMPAVLGSKIQLAGVFQILIANTLRYRGNAKPRIVFSAMCSENMCTTSVRDNGMGFEPEYAEQIFEPFKRLHGHDCPGSGLGLSTARKIAERHNGRIWAESRPGEGAAFYLTLPLASV